MKTGVLTMTLLLSFAVLAPYASAEDNPFLVPYDTPWDVPPFDKIHNEHYMPAFEKGIADQRAEVTKIRDNAAAPTFENTIVALETSGELLTRVSDVFFNLNDAETNDEMQQVARDVAPMLSALNDDIFLDPKLFARVKAVHEKRDKRSRNACWKRPTSSLCAVARISRNRTRKSSGRSTSDCLFSHSSSVRTSWQRRIVTNS